MLVSHIPCDVLKPYVKTFVITESDEESVYKIFPGTEVVMGFQYQGSLSRLEQGKPLPLAAAGITGLLDSYRIFKNSGNTGTVLVYFSPGGAARFFRQPIHELFAESVSLDNFILRSEVLVLEEQLQETVTDAGRISVVEQFLISRMNSVAPDPLVLNALALIHQSKGNIRIKALAAQLHTSQSPLEKKFRQAVGTSPKKFAAIVRFKHVLHQYDPHQPLGGLGYEAGFYDQAHFIKTFKTFTGETPETFFGQS